MAEHEVTIELTDEAKDLLVEKGWDPAMGARPLRRAIQRYIEDPLADFVLRSELTPGATVMVDRDEGGTTQGGPNDGQEQPEVKLTIIQPDPAKVPAAVGAPEEEATDDEPKATDDEAPAAPDAPPAE
jgi:ATP-dependent Clp protease ATP-binding subunit ClpC